MDWTPASVASSENSVPRSSSPINLVLKTDGSIIAQTGNGRILETVNRSVWSWSRVDYYDNGMTGLIQSAYNHSDGILGPVRSGPPCAPKAQVHLSCAREVLDRRRKIAEKSQDKLYRMGKKRKIHDEGIEIRKILDRPTKRQCDERTRDIGLLTELDAQLIVCESEPPRSSKQPSILTSHKHLLPLSPNPLEASASCHYSEGFLGKSLTNGRTTRRSPLSQCYTLSP